MTWTILLVIRSAVHAVNQFKFVLIWDFAVDRTCSQLLCIARIVQQVMDNGDGISSKAKHMSKTENWSAMHWATCPIGVPWKRNMEANLRRLCVFTVHCAFALMASYGGSQVQSSCASFLTQFWLICLYAITACGFARLDLVSSFQFGSEFDYYFWSFAQSPIYET